MTNRLTHIALTNSEGIGEVLQFDGLGLKITVLPTPETCGEPTITKQAFYFLQDLEAAAKVRISMESALMQQFSANEQSQVILYILDNYLFTFSLFDERSKMTSKVERGFLEETIRKRYTFGDKGNVKYLMVDTLNDDSIISCKDTANPEISFEQSAKLFCDYFEDIYDKYVKDVESLFGKQVLLKTKTSIEILPVLKLLKRPYKYDELVTMSNYINFVEENDPRIKKGVYKYDDGFLKFEIPMRHFSTNEYHNPSLLNLYFAGLREKSPLIQFKNYYNIIEYVFEDAVVEECKRHLSEEAKLVNDISGCEKWKEKLDDHFRYDRSKLKSEETQLTVSINMFVEKSELVKKITSDSNLKEHFLKPAPLTKEVTVPPLKLDDDNFLDNYARRIYLIRNSVIHTKRTTHGKMVPAILPFSIEEFFLEEENCLLKFCAQRIIQKEKNIFDYTPMGFSPAEILLLIHMLVENKNYQTIVNNLGIFLRNINSKIRGYEFYPILDQIAFFWLDIFDEIRLRKPEEIERLSKVLQEIDIQSFDDATQCAVKCLQFIFQNEMEKFNVLVERLPLMTMRANLRRLSNSLNFHFRQKKRKTKKLDY